ncbi:DUF4405 domain-containing protein [Leisingera sp. HS039]|nr:DUF4405 domain-containing protein [Leisingera sp. HS039]QBR38875.1 DUF4405 domain-containing protein [Leisingera sp. NJS201]
MLLSGGILFFAPKGKIFKEVGWDALGLGRQDWSDLHIVLAALFIAFSLWHAAHHLHVFKTLFFGSKMSSRGHRAEALIAFAAVAGLTVLAFFSFRRAAGYLS